MIATLRQERDIALAISCDYCHADVGQQCTNTLTGKPLHYVAAHWLRLKTAREGLPF